MKKKVEMAGLLLICLGFAVGISLLIRWGGNYPAGTDTMGYLYKGNMLYHDIGQGTWYPLYDVFWYNGVQPIRYQAPLPVYFLAFCQWIAGGSSLDGYLIFVSLIFYFGVLGWLYIGYRRDRLWLGAFLGILWFFMPDNLYTLFVEGNLPGALAAVLLPVWMELVSRYLFENDRRALAGAVPVLTGIVLCQVEYAFMILISMLIFLMIYRILYHGTGRCIPVVLVMILPFLLAGVWLYASGKGIAAAQETTGTGNVFQDALVSLNPLRRLTRGNAVHYFGISAFIVTVFGALCSKKHSMSGFWTAVVFFLCSTTSVYGVLEKLPGSHYLQMLSFLSIALAMLLYSFMRWSTLKSGFVILCALLLAVDCIPSLALVYQGKGKISVSKRMQEMADACLITDARKLTSQRVALLDGGSLGAMAPYLLTGYDQKQVKGSFGAGNASAATAVNIAELEEAAENGYYRYLFDRALELGNDTILIQIDELKGGAEDIREVSRSAEMLGYKLAKQNNSYLLYHMDTYTTFGTVCQYDGIAIGKTAASLTYSDPDITKGASVSLDDYTFRELSEYKVIYLSGFSYTNKSAAEKLVKKLSDAGVKVIISGDGIPKDRTTKERSFLGVSCQDIYFQNGYPDLYTSDGELNTELFARGASDWKTVYLNGLKKADGYLFDSGRRIDFSGTAYNDNIVFIGLNLSYHYFLTQDENVEDYLQKLMGTSLKELPERTIVPLKITYGRRKIRIESGKDDVNTSLAYHDIFESSRKLSQEHALTVVSRGTTVITLKYPYLLQGIFLSLGGIAAYLVFIWWLKQRASDRH